MENETTQVEITSTRELLINHRNTFQKDFVGNTLDLKRHLIIKAENPTYVREDSKTGKDIGIDKLIEKYSAAAKNAKHYLDIINEVLELNDEAKMVDALVAILNSASTEEAKA